MTEVKRKRGPGRPEERRENREAASERQKRSERLEWQKQQREDIKNRLEDQSPAGEDKLALQYKNTAMSKISQTHFDVFFV